VRSAVPPILLALLALGLGFCERRPEELPWEHVDLVALRPEIEAKPPAGEKARIAAPLISYLGSEEVRNLHLVPARQLSQNPRRTAGQVRALRQRAASRVRWTLEPGREAYFSFVPLGSEMGCPCTYVVSAREAGANAVELHRSPARPVAVLAPRAVEIDLSRYAGRRIDLLLQVDGPGERLRGQPAPSALWGSPAVYSRKPAAVRTPERDGSRPNILLLGFDTLRADALGAWGRNPSLTPSLDRLAAESDIWLDAYSTFNVTNPSFVSILTGLYGKNHGVYDLRTPLPPSHTTLAELLSGAGYDTLAFIAASHLGDHNSGLGQGFGRVERSTEHFAAELPVDEAMDWIAGRSGSPKPFFIWLHLFDPHTPHTPPDPFALGLRPASPAGLGPVREWIPFRETGPRTFDEPILGGHRDLYDGEVAYLDRQVGRLLAFLESRGLLEDTLIAVVADHGENLGDHGILYRHAGLWDTTTHVPLMIRWPGRAREGRRIPGLVQTIDLFPTLVAAAGLEAPPQDGIDLRELTGPGRNGRRVVFAEHADRLGLMARTPHHKYIFSQGNTLFLPDGAYLYDLKTDPREEKNLAGRGLPAEERMQDLLTRWLADRKRRGPDPKARELTDEERARLKALGYG
jgi:arylsulfatase